VELFLGQVKAISYRYFYPLIGFNHGYITKGLDNIDSQMEENNRQRKGRIKYVLSTRLQTYVKIHIL